MTSTPIYDAAPRGGGAGVQNVVDIRIVYTLNAIIKYPAARDLVRLHPPEIFPAGAARSIASAIVAGVPWTPAMVTAGFSHEAREIIRELEQTQIPFDEAWALHLIRLLVEDAHLPILAEQLRWVALRVEGATVPPLRWLKRQIDLAFTVAMGEEVAA